MNRCSDNVVNVNIEKQSRWPQDHLARIRTTLPSE